MKTIKINESQKIKLFEDVGFSVETLKMIGDSAFYDENTGKAQYQYCRKYLGEPIGVGSGRIVFQLNENMVIKLARESSWELGRECNKYEVQMFQSIDSPLLTRIYYYDDHRFTFLVSEQVLPVRPSDFEKLVGLTFFGTYQQQSSPEKSKTSRHGGDREIGFDKYFDNIKPAGTKADNLSVSQIVSYLENRKIEWTEEDDEEYEAVIRNNKWLTEIKKLINATETGIGDLGGNINNFGMVNRDGKPLIVVLDSGFSLW